MKTQPKNTDSIARIRTQWQLECPELDTTPMELIGRILRIGFITQARMRSVFRQHGVDSGGFDVLATLRRSGAPYRLTPTKLYKELILTSGAMTNRLDALERNGWIVRIPDPDDRRGTLIELTKQGSDLLDQAMDSHLEGEASLVAHLTKAEQKDLAKLLKKLLQKMEAEHE
jgi:DNA-binding MarR family transcriptional regulator